MSEWPTLGSRLSATSHKETGLPSRPERIGGGLENLKEKLLALPDDAIIHRLDMTFLRAYLRDGIPGATPDQITHLESILHRNAGLDRMERRAESDRVLDRLYPPSVDTPDRPNPPRMSIPATVEFDVPGLEQDPVDDQPARKRRGRTAGVNHVDIALTFLNSRLKDGESTAIAEIARQAGCTSKNLRESDRFMKAYRSLTQAMVRVVRNKGFKKADGELEAWTDPRGDREEDE